MSRPRLLLTLAGAVWLGVATLAAWSGRALDRNASVQLHQVGDGVGRPSESSASTTPNARQTAASDAPAAPDAGEYVGSDACRRCHEPEYETWRKNLHVQMTKPIADARVLGDFRPGTRLQESGRSYEME